MEEDFPSFQVYSFFFFSGLFLSAQRSRENTLHSYQSLQLTSFLAEISGWGYRKLNYIGMKCFLFDCLIFKYQKI